MQRRSNDYAHDVYHKFLLPRWKLKKENSVDDNERLHQRVLCISFREASRIYSHKILGASNMMLNRRGGTTYTKCSFRILLHIFNHVSRRAHCQTQLAAAIDDARWRPQLSLSPGRNEPAEAAAAVMVYGGGKNSRPVNEVNGRVEPSGFPSFPRVPSSQSLHVKREVKLQEVR